MTEWLIYVTSYYSPLITAVHRRTLTKMNSHLPRDVQAACVTSTRVAGAVILGKMFACFINMSKRKNRNQICLMEPLFSAENRNLCALC